MAVPKKKRTRGSAGKRQSHDGLGQITLSKCPKCGHSVRPHRACHNCGTYKGRQEMEVRSKAEKTS